MVDAILSFDHRLFLLLNTGIANPILDRIFVFVTHGRSWIVPAGCGALLYYRSERKKGLIIMALAVLLASMSDPLCVRILKPVFHRLRPCDPRALAEGARFLAGHSQAYSFPSAHAFNMFAQAALWTALYRRLWPAFFGFAALIGFSRIYVGVHYPLDVAAGAVMGSLFGLLFFLAVRKASGPKWTLVNAEK